MARQIRLHAGETVRGRRHRLQIPAKDRGQKPSRDEDRHHRQDRKSPQRHPVGTARIIKYKKHEAGSTKDDKLRIVLIKIYRIDFYGMDRFSAEADRNDGCGRPSGFVPRNHGILQILPLMERIVGQERYRFRMDELDLLPLPRSIAHKHQTGKQHKYKYHRVPCGLG